MSYGCILSFPRSFSRTFNQYPICNFILHLGFHSITRHFSWIVQLLDIPQRQLKKRMEKYILPRVACRPQCNSTMGACSVLSVISRSIFEKGLVSISPRSSIYVRTVFFPCSVRIIQLLPLCGSCCSCYQYRRNYFLHKKASLS